MMRHGMDGMQTVDDTAEKIFALIGNVLTCVATMAMLLVLVSNERSRRSVRPRMLMVLASLDFLWGVFGIIWFASLLHTNTNSFQMTRYTLGSKIGSLPFMVLMKISEAWTCIIVFHVLLIVSPRDEPLDERKYERRYLAFIMIFGFVYFILLENGVFGPDGIMQAGMGSKGQYQVSSCQMSVEVAYWVVCSFLLIKLFRLNLSHSQRFQRYRMQAVKFFLFLVLCTGGRLVAMTGGAIEKSFKLSGALLWWEYTMCWLGVFNVYVWGVSRQAYVRAVVENVPSLQRRLSEHAKTELTSIKTSGSVLMQPNKDLQATVDSEVDSEVDRVLKTKTKSEVDGTYAMTSGEIREIVAVCLRQSNSGVVENPVTTSDNTAMSTDTVADKEKLPVQEF